MFTSYFYKFLKLFSRGYKTKLLTLFMMSVIAGFLEFVGIALIFPLVILILKPEQLYNLPFIADIGQKIGTIPTVSLIGISIIAIFIVKNLFMVSNSYIQISVLKTWQREISQLIFKKYLFSSYESKLSLPTNFSLFQVTQLCEMVFDNFIAKVLNLFSSAVILFVILVFLVWKFNFWAILTCIFFIACGLIQNKFFKTKGREYTKKRILLMNDGNKSILSALHNIKDIKIFAKEEYFYKLYKIYIKDITKVYILANFFTAIPQNIIEICIIAAILIMSLGVVYTSNGNSQVMVASFGLLAAAVFRMAPLVNKVQMNMNYINANKPIIQEFFEAYKIYSKIPELVATTDEKFNLKNKIIIKNLSFSYASKNILSNINLEIKRGEFIGIIGKSGVGKTTFIDILMGLLTPNTGEILADNERLCEKSAQKWLNSIGYVPQEITTLPVTIAQNIAFGVEPDKIDYERIKSVINTAQLSDYILNLENGINTNLNSLQSLSQGQKQRLGIARALYKNPDILFLDEVTSALDVETENKITECLNALKGQKTIIAIAHRLSTLKKCDRIFYFKSDHEVICGTFDELLLQDKTFNDIVKLSSVR